VAATLDAVEGTIGVDYRETLAELDRVRGAHRDLTGQLRAVGREATTLAARLGALAERRAADADARDRATAARAAAAYRFRHLATGRIGADSTIDDPARFRAALSSSEGVRAALEAARQVAAAWPTLPHAPNNLGDALHRLAETVHACRTTLN